MVQTRTYSNVLNMAYLLPIQEQERLIRDMQEHVSHSRIVLNEDKHYTWEELRAGVREAEEQFARGEVYTAEEDDRMFDAFISQELGVAL